MNYIWGGMLLTGIIYGAFQGNFQNITNAAIDFAKEAVTLCITMTGILAFWTGLMEIAKNNGIIEGLSRRLQPVLRFLFPHIPKGHPAGEQILTNMIANMLGLGWAATPAGLRAMEELSKLQEERRCETEKASNEMCTFLVLNISSLQLIPMTIIAFRSQYGSVNPTGIIGPGILATLCSTIAAVVFCKIMIWNKTK